MRDEPASLRIVTFRTDGSPWRAGIEQGGMLVDLQMLPSHDPMRPCP